MIVTTTEAIPGYEVTEVLGVARGNSIRGRHIGKDILAHLRNVVGGELHEYTKMMAETREQAYDRMVEHAESLGANAVICMRFSTAEMMQGAAEFLVYGTAVTARPLKRE